ncbi:hypothetical protein ACWEQ8_00890 [Streptomyces noursei]
MHGFTVDLAWSAGQATSFTLPNTGPASATPTVASAARRRQLTPAAQAPVVQWQATTVSPTAAR